MSSTATAAPDPSGGGGSSDDDAELIIAVVALVISILAFVIAILQTLQQYLATATGWTSCSEAVIGKWHNFTRRKMVWTELRFDVQFEAPVIFVARPENTRGPLGSDDQAKDESKKIIRLDGSPNNFKYTDTTAEFNDEYKQSTLKKVIHTADNEKATWYALLMAVVRMEQESREWQGKKSAEYNEWIKKAGPQQIDTEKPDTHHSLLVMMQRKRRTWDSMPKDFAKPYATTTISHIVEIAGMLGIHWRLFDLNNDQYRAQGNGFVLLGSYTDGLGITFNFQKQGPTWFEKSRVVPSYNVKQLCFGMAPTIFTNQEKKVYADEAKGAESLQLGSFAELAKTLVVFGCDINTVNYFRVNTDQARHSHLFAVPFEILGMVGEMLHVKGTVFRMLPNPTVFYWDPSSFSLPTLLNEYITALKDLRQKSVKDSPQINQIIEWAEKDAKFPLLRTEGSTLDIFGQDINGATLVNGLNHLRSGIELCDEYFGKMKKPSLPLVKKVFRHHIQEIMTILHEKETDEKKDEKQDTNDAVDDTPITINDIDSASVDEKEVLLIQMYFNRVREKVVRIVGKPHPSKHVMRARKDSFASDNITSPISPRPGLENREDEANDIWCTFVFRMLCWLQLHDFHKMDVNISKSDAYASRIPVYIV